MQIRRNIWPVIIAVCATLTGATIQASRAAEVGTLIHFPAKLDAPKEEWDQAEKAAISVRKTLGADAWLRFDGLWHEMNWEPFAPTGFARNRRILEILKAHQLRPLFGLTPHPWPGSEWAAPWQPKRDWGDPDPRMFDWIAQRYAADIADYRAALRDLGFKESECAIQFGNEPASGHPGGNGALPEGTWSAHALWTKINAVTDYGALQVVSPAISMQDHPAEVALRERSTAVPPAEQNWTAPIDHWALHHRYYKPDAANAETYAQGWVSVLKQRAQSVLNLPWPKGDAPHQAERDKGLWVTESYIASGDAPGDRAEDFRALLPLLKQDIPGVRVVFLYRWFPAGGPGGLDWQVPIGTFDADDARK